MFIGIRTSYDSFIILYRETGSESWSKACCDVDGKQDGSVCREQKVFYKAMVRSLSLSFYLFSCCCGLDGQRLVNGPMDETSKRYEVEITHYAMSLLASHHCADDRARAACRLDVVGR